VVEKKQPVEYFFPKTAKEACEIKKEYGNGARFIAGGTDLLLLMAREAYHPQALIDINRIPALNIISINGSKATIGAAVTYNQILNCRQLCKASPFVEKAIRTIGGVQVRNVATMVGNIANASPAADTLPPLYVLKTKIHLADGEQSRMVPVEDFILGVRKTDLRAGEMITHITFDFPQPGDWCEFDKLGLRKAMAISVVSVALFISFDNNQVKKAEIALGSVAPTVIKVPGVQSALAGHSLNEKTIEDLAELASQAACPIDDVRGSAQYRKLAVAGMVRRSLNKRNGNKEEKER
jgi:CO/xanthine dehydrogenase FAD-binding subunit